MSERKHVACPETGALQQVELEHTSVGLVVSGCSRFPDGVLACARGCARRLDQREHNDLEARERVLIVLANLHDDAAHVATKLAQELAGDGLVVEVAEIGSRGIPPLADYDGVIVGAHVRFGHHTREVVDYIRDHLVELRALPAFFYSVGSRATLHRDRDAQRLALRTGWRPAEIWTFTDASDLQDIEVRAFSRLVADEIPQALQPSFA